jgi:hypothetical protein
MFDKTREKLAQKADELDAKADGVRTKPFFESDDIIAVQMTIGGIKQALNTVSDYKKQGFRIAGIVEQETLHTSLIILEKAT